MEGHLPGTGGRRRKYRSQEGELPNQLVYAGMTETKNLLFYQALLWMGKFKKDESKRRRPAQWTVVSIPSEGKEL